MLTLRLLRVNSRRFSFANAQFHGTSILLAKRKVLQQFRLADIGEGITECEVVKWIVRPSSVVQSFDALCEVQSDKASVEITSPFDGIIKELLVKEGDVAKVGEGLCLIEIEEDAEETDERSSVASEPKRASEEAQAPSQVLEQVIRSQSLETNSHPLDEYDPCHASESSLLNPTRDDVLASPSVRHFARQKGVNLATIGVGSGKSGRVEKKDVEAILSSTSGPSQSSTFSEVQVEFSRTRFAMWKSMTKSLEIPHFGYSTTFDLTRLSELLPTLDSHIPPTYMSGYSNSTTSHSPAIASDMLLSKPSTTLKTDPTTQYSRLTFLPLLLKTLSRAMLRWPIFRSSIYSSDISAKRKPILNVRTHADIMVALSTPTGLYTPTLTAVDTLSPYAIMGRLRQLQHLGRQIPCALGPGEMPRLGGTITVSNVGAIGRGDYAAPVLVPGGGVAIVAIGRAKWVDVVPEDGVGVPRRRLVVGVSWSADHRIVEGAELAAFVEDWRGWVEYPERLIGDAV